MRRERLGSAHRSVQRRRGRAQALLGAASGQMSAFYGLPGGMGAGMSDSKLPDNQAGFEKGLTMGLAALSGGGFVYESAGMLASLLGCSFEAMVIDDDMLSSIRRIARGSRSRTTPCRSTSSRRS